MRAWQCDRLDDPPKLRPRDLEAFHPGPGEILIAVHAAGIGYVDALICAGRYQLRPEPPFVPGREVAGCVTTVGEGIAAGRPGDRARLTARIDPLHSIK